MINALMVDVQMQLDGPLQKRMILFFASLIERFAAGALLFSCTLGQLAFVALSTLNHLLTRTPI